MDRPLKAVPDNLFHNIYRQYDKVVCSQFVQITHSAYSITTNDFGVLKQRLVKHQQYISNGFALSRQKRLNTFLNKLFNAISAERISSERACHVSQL